MNRLEYLSKFKFRVFPCRENQKTPAIQNWRNEAKIDFGITGNYGVIASGTDYNGCKIVIVDLDNHKEESESGVSFWERNGFLDKTFTVETPSGGKHLYFLADTEMLNRIKRIGGYKLHPQIDFFWQDNHYILGVGSKVNGKEYKVINTAEPALLPEVVITLLASRKENDSKEESRNVETTKSEINLNRYEKELILRLAEEKQELLDDYTEWFSLMAAFKNSGFDIDDFKRISWQDEKTQREIDYKWKSITPRNNEAGFGSIIYKIAPLWGNLSWRYDKIESIAIEEAIKMFPQLHKVIIGKDVCVIDESMREKSTLRDYRNTYACYQDKQHRILFPVKREKRIEVQSEDAFPIWYKNAPLLQGRVCEPSLPFGEIEIDGEKLFNDWEESSAKKGKGTTEIFWQHIRENVCNGDAACFEYLQHWIWDLIANPLHRNGIAVAISGNQGCGKSIVGNVLALCFHPKYVSTINNSCALMDKFDSGYKNSILCMLEESTFAGERKSGIWSKMKDIITSAQTTCERKGFDVERIKNKIHFLITSNDSFVVPKTQGDRRYFVVKCNDNQRCNTEFFAKMMEEMKNGGAAALIAEAKQHKEECLSYNFLNIPETDIGTENAIDSAPLLLRFLVSKLDEYSPENGFDDMPFFVKDGKILVNSTKLIECLPNKMKDDGYITQRSVGRQLKEWFGGKESIDCRIPYPIEEKTMKCFVFCSVEELKRCITQHYFMGFNPFN